MDAHNATEPATMNAVASPRRDAARSSSPINDRSIRAASLHSEDTTPDQNSDAETIVLPGKDGISPSKPRKVIKHEEQSDGEIDRNLPSAPRMHGKDKRSADGDHVASAAAAKIKRFADKDKQRQKDGASSGLSSAPASPPPRKRSNTESTHRRRPSQSSSDTDTDASKSCPKVSAKDRTKPFERHLPGKRKINKTESDDEFDMRKARRARVSEGHLDSSATARGKDRRPSSSRHHADRSTSGRPRSISPQARSHRRSASTQLPSQMSNGLSAKKRRIPAPLQSTDYQSDDSSASGSPHPRSSKLKHLTTPMTGDSTMSPAKSAHHKRHVDNHGQTQLAKACAKGEYELAKRRLTERPEDLNFADYAGNTPLQVASLAGHDNVVKLLIEAGCKLDCRNSDKETPLLDAVENGHLEVVKILLDAGVNPRKADAEGHEPLEKVPDDIDNAEEIRAALQEAKERMGEIRRTSEDHMPQDIPDDNSSRGQESPRRSPPPSATGRRGGNVRSTKTSNHLLYMALDEKTLRVAAGKGDEETVTRVLLVKEHCDDPESLVAAARGGHNVVMELLLALGGANPDPDPVKSLPSPYATPMLAAIGQENTQVIRLLLDQNGFNPTRLHKGQAYHEIARRREGPMWKEEETMLKNAYDSYKKSPRNTSRNKSPNRRDRERVRERDTDNESHRDAQLDAADDSGRMSKRRLSNSVSAEGGTKKKQGPGKPDVSPVEKRRSSSFGNREEQTSPKRGPGRPKKEERPPSHAASDREQSPAASRAVASKPKRADSELAAGSSDGESMKPRRKLISGKDLKGEREKQRRASLVSSNSGADRADAKADDADKPRPEALSEKYHDRTKALKRDDSRDRISTGDGSAKRHRASMTPPNGSEDKDDSEAPIKRRKLDTDEREKRRADHSLADPRALKRGASREPVKRPKTDDERKELIRLKNLNRERRESEKPSEKPPPESTSSKTPVNADVDMHDAPDDPKSVGSELQAEKDRKEALKKKRSEFAAAEKKRSESAAAEEAKKQNEDKKRREAELKQKHEAREAREAEEQRQREAEKKRAEAKREEEERKRKEEEKEQARQEEERKRQEELEMKRREEEEARRKREKEEEEERLRREKEEEERLRREKEAAEEAKRLREEEEQRERERQQAIREAEQREAEMQRQREEEDRIRRSKLPPLLRWLETTSDPKRTEIAKLFAIAQGVRYDTIDPTATGKPGGRELWLLNTQAALLLGEKHASLPQYSDWERVPASTIAKRVIWRLEMERYALTAGKLYHLGEELTDYYGGDPRRVGYKKLEELRGTAAQLFFDSDMFFVKLSDFLHQVSNTPHLRDVKISVHYRELPETEGELNTFSTPHKWKQDPDSAGHGPFAPRYKYYVNGQLVSEERPRQSAISRTPFPDHAAPRRAGLIAVTPEEPDYARLCLEQGLGHLLSEHEKQLATNGVSHLTPRSMRSNGSPEHEGALPSPSDISPGATHINGVKGAGSPESHS